MASDHSSSSSRSNSQGSNVMWEQGDDYTDFEHNSSPSHPEIQSPLSSPSISPPPIYPMSFKLQRLKLHLHSRPWVSLPNLLPFSQSSITTSSNKGGRPKKGLSFHGNRYTPISPQPTQSKSTIESSPRKRKQSALKLIKRGYCSLFRTPRPSITRGIELKTPEGTTISKRAGKPTGMRLLDIGILSEAITKLHCYTCNSPLSLFESNFLHGWQTTFTIKCPRCHLLHAEFPSSKPMDLPAELTRLYCIWHYMGYLYY